MKVLIILALFAVILAVYAADYPKDGIICGKAGETKPTATNAGCLSCADKDGKLKSCPDACKSYGLGQDKCVAVKDNKPPMKCTCVKPFVPGSPK